MVRAISLAAAIGLMVGNPAVAAPDWRAAGGELFINRATAPAQSVETLHDAAAASHLDPMRQPYADEIAAAARTHGLDPNLLHAIVIVESAYRANAVSPAGAVGLMQFMPRTAQDEGLMDRTDPVANVFAGADYLTRLLVRFGDLRLALAAYNTGPGRIAQLGRIPNPGYVQAVIDCFLALSAGRSVRTSRQCPASRIAP